MTEHKEKKDCKHCGGDIKIRSPKGYCDHLHYPETCDVCSTPIEPDTGERAAKIRKGAEAFSYPTPLDRYERQTTNYRNL